MLSQIVTVGPLVAAAANKICLSQSAAGAQALTLNGSVVSDGVATLDKARRVLITSAGNDTGITFRVTGTNSTGNAIRESVTGASGAAVATLQDYKTVSDITTSGATAGNVTVGTNGVASSPWVFVSPSLAPVNIALGVVVSGTVNYTIEYTYDNPNTNQNTLGSQGLGNYPTAPTPWQHASLRTLTSTTDGAITFPIAAWRLLLNSQTNPGYATATGTQAGIAGP